MSKMGWNLHHSHYQQQQRANIHKFPDLWAESCWLFFWAFTGRHRWMPPTVFSVPQARETDEITEVFFLFSSYHSERLWHTQQVIFSAENRSSSSNKHHTKGSVWWIMLIYYNLMFINNKFNYSRAFLRALERSLGAVPRLMNIFNSEWKLETWYPIWLTEVGIGCVKDFSFLRRRRRQSCVFFFSVCHWRKWNSTTPLSSTFVAAQNYSKLRVGNFFSPLCRLTDNINSRLFTQLSEKKKRE